MRRYSLYMGGILGLALLLYGAMSGRQHSEPSPNNVCVRSMLKTLSLLAPARYVPSAKDLEYGESQVLQMVRDRPPMGRYIHKGDPIWKYSVRQFAGEGTGVRITWCKERPLFSTADCFSPTQCRGASLRVRSDYVFGPRQGGDRSGDELWESAVFELNNLRSYKQFNELDEKVLNGTVTRQDYITGYARLEYRTELNAARVYNVLWRSNMQQRRIGLLPWECTRIPDTYDQWIASFGDQSDYPWKMYGKYYDEMLGAARTTSNYKMRNAMK